jgi:hypothetical protein
MSQRLSSSQPSLSPPDNSNASSKQGRSPNQRAVEAHQPAAKGVARRLRRIDDSPRAMALAHVSAS